METQERARQNLPPEDTLEIRYEDICQNPVKVFQTATEFSGLEWSPKFEAAIQRFTFKSADYKWREHLTQTQQEMLNDCLGDTLRKYGYEGYEDPGENPKGFPIRVIYC